MVGTTTDSTTEVAATAAQRAEQLAPTPLWEKLRVLYRVVLIFLSAIPTTTLIPLPLTQLLTGRFRREERLKRLHCMVPWATFVVRRILKVRLEVEGRELLPRPSRGHIYVCNHQSNVDIVVLMSALDTVAFLSKRLVERIPVIGRCAYCGGTVYFSRGDKSQRARALAETLRMSRESTAVVVFPEGTRSAEGTPRATVHPRSMEACFRQGLRVVPVGLDGTWRVLNKAMDRVRLRQPVAVRIGATLDPGDFPDSRSFADACWRRVRELHAECRERVEGRRQLPGGSGAIEG